jgi:hypothetical protein
LIAFHQRSQYGAHFDGRGRSEFPRLRVGSGIQILKRVFARDPVCFCNVSVGNSDGLAGSSEVTETVTIPVSLSSEIWLTSL